MEDLNVPYFRPDRDVFLGRVEMRESEVDSDGLELAGGRKPGGRTDLWME